MATKAARPAAKGGAQNGKTKRRAVVASTLASPPAKPTHRWVLVLEPTMKRRMRYLPIEG